MEHQTRRQQAENRRDAIAGAGDVVRQPAQHFHAPGSRAISSSASRSAAASASASAGSIRPPGKLTWPACWFRCALRLVSSTPGSAPQHDRHQHGGRHRRLVQQRRRIVAVGDRHAGGRRCGRSPISRARSSADVIPAASALIGAITSSPGGSSPSGKNLPQLQTPSIAPAADPFRHRQRHQFVVDRATDARLDRPAAVAVAHLDIGRRLAGQDIVRDADRMIGAGGDRSDRRWCGRTALVRPSPPQSSSTATKGASSTSMRPRSAGVSSQNAPSASRFSTLANRQTSSFRWIGCRDTARCRRG